MKQFHIIILILAVVVTAFISFRIAKSYYQEETIKDVVTENAIDSTYIWTLEDSIATLMSEVPEKETKWLDRIVYKDSVIYDTIRLKPEAYKSYEYTKSFLISDDSNNFQFDVDISGIDSLFSNKLKQYLIQKKIEVSVSNFKYSVVSKHKIEKNSLFQLYFGIGQGIYTYNLEQLYSAKLGIDFIIKEKHLISFNKSFVLDGYEVWYKYRLFKF